MVSILKDLPIFKHLKENHMDLLGPLFESFTCNAGTTILQQGMPANYLYLVISGKVQVSYKPYDGNPITVAHVKRGGLFGWSAVVGSKNYTSSAVAIEALEAKRIKGSALRKLCIDHPEAGKDILESLANSVSSRWKDANEQVRSILTQGLQNQ
jgi:CRP-like cAMP-binding protein